jgi:hypothetical protein
VSHGTARACMSDVGWMMPSHVSMSRKYVTNLSFPWLPCFLPSVGSGSSGSIWRVCESLCVQRVALRVAAAWQRLIISGSASCSSCFMGLPAGLVYTKCVLVSSWCCRPHRRWCKGSSQAAYVQLLGTCLPVRQRVRIFEQGFEIAGKVCEKAACKQR